MAVRITNEIITTGYQFDNKTDYLNTVGVSGELDSEEAQLFETYRTQNKLFKHQIEFDTNRVIVSRWMDSQDSIRELQSDLSNLYRSWNCDFGRLVQDLGWTYQMSIDLDATVPQ